MVAALRSRHGGRPGSAPSSIASPSASALNGTGRSVAAGTRRTSKTRRPAPAALAWWAILLLTASAILILIMGKRGVRRGLFELRQLLGTERSGSKSGVRGGNSDPALLDAAHEQRKDAVDAALHTASAMASYQSSAGEPTDDPNNLTDYLGSRLHVVFSTDCGTFQHWQSFLLFYSALRVGQPGRVTRIASGCKEEEEAEAQRWFEEHVRPMSSRFGIHFTPHFSKVTDENGEEKGDYKVCLMHYLFYFCGHYCI